ncbi:MAG: ABC transporter ATP-binding protein [Erysipelotrichaceae bacterium]|nr:ABC transporter ATP-binding protein [Erysipelotrichaceae bacterium]
MKKLIKYIGNYRNNSYKTILYVILETVVECFIPFVTAALVNRVKSGTSMEEIIRYGLILFILAMISLMFGRLAGIEASIASCGLAKNLRYEMFSNIQSFAFENIDKFQTSSLVTRMTTDVTNVQMAYMMMIRAAIRAPLVFILSMIMSYVMGGPLALMFLVTVPILLLGLVVITNKAMPMFRKVFKKYDNLNNIVQENIKGMRVVKAFVREDYEKNKFDKAAKAIFKDFTKIEKIIANAGPLMTCSLNVDMIFFLYFGAYLIISSAGTNLNVGELSAMVTYGFQIMVSLMMLTMVYVMITMAHESSIRINEVIVEKALLVNKEDGLNRVEDGSIIFKNVNFKYDLKAERYALSNININIPSGATIGILGNTGSSKSTLIQLIARLYDVVEGEVIVSGHNVKDYDLKVLRDNVALVLQKNVLFSGTIKENLRFGNENASNEEIIAACKLAQADTFINSFKDGYDTYLKQGGVNLSGGQKQRLCLARALLKYPKILILDDSTSALDMKTDALLRQGLKTYLPHMTKIIVAQRVASIMEADQIILLDKGSVKAIGSHEELLKKSSAYAETYLSQLKGVDDYE